MEESMVDTRKEDKTIKDFIIPMQENVGWVLLNIHSVHIIQHDEVTIREVDLQIRKDDHMQLAWPNGIWKSTLLEKIVNWDESWATLGEWVKIGYYRQDFSNLDFKQTVIECLREAAWEEMTEQDLRSKAAGFLINGDLMKTEIWYLSEWQKWLVAFCRIVFLKPGLIILDEPTNHINFRHIPVIAKALDEYKGGMILVSHVNEFVWQIRMDQYLDL
jgi:ATP-binding cassette subfamily F protein 3